MPLISIVTVIQDAPTRDLTTLATLKDEIGIADNSMDVRLSRWISEASAQIESYCNRIFAQQTLQEVFRISPEYRFLHFYEPAPLSLRRRPVTTIASVAEDINGTHTLGTDYEFDPDLGFVWRLDATTNARIQWQAVNTITVQYTAGYALLGSLPRPIEQACLRLIVHRWAARDRDPMLRSENIPGVIDRQFWVGAIGGNGALPPEVEDLIAPFREIPA